jgi:5-methylcytosine-specific restriction endonuclease McrA
MVDHIKPINQGGSIWNKDNLQTLCNRCHNKKSAKDK